MNWATAEIKHSWRRWWRLALIAGAVLVAAGVVATIFAFTKPNTSSRCSRTSVRGEPVTGAELDAFYGGQNPRKTPPICGLRPRPEVERTIQVPRSGEYRNVPIQGNTESAGRRIPLPAQPGMTGRYRSGTCEVAASVDALHAAAAFGGHTRYPGSIANITAIAPLSSIGFKSCCHHAARRLQLEKRASGHTRKIPPAWPIHCTPP